MFKRVNVCVFVRSGLIRLLVAFVTLVSDDIGGFGLSFLLNFCFLLWFFRIFNSLPLMCKIIRPYFDCHQNPLPLKGGTKREKKSEWERVHWVSFCPHDIIMNLRCFINFMLKILIQKKIKKRIYCIVEIDHAFDWHCRTSAAVVCSKNTNAGILNELEFKMPW